ncbi:MAG: putative bifunctional diguanylate cyclase/phosphodiesterase [Ilumatobacteraceae bacterium]
MIPHESSPADDEARSVSFRLSGVLDSSPDPDLDRWTPALLRHTGAIVAAICLVDGSRRFVKSMCAAGGSLDRVIALAPAESLESCIVNLARSIGATDRPITFTQAPVTVDGHVMGRVCIAGYGDWADSDLDALADTAAAVSTEVALRVARSEAKRVNDLVASHNRVHDLIAQEAPLREVLLGILESIERHDPSIKASVLMFDPSSSTLHSGVGPSFPPGYLASIDGVVIGPNVGTCGSAAWHRHMVITENIADDPKWAPIREIAKNAGLSHCWSMPILVPGGEVLGTLAFYGSRPRLPLPEHLTLIQDWAHVAGIAIERHRALDRLIHEARHDGLTGLPNRMAILERLDEAIQRVNPGAMAAVLFIDLDDLKVLNDSLGHDRADEMLREVSRRLSATVRVDGFVGRFGGDEFVVIAEGIADAEEAAALGLRLLEAISQPLPGVEMSAITASIGVTLVRSNAMGAHEAIRESDHAMYDAKRSGRDRLAFFQGGQRVRTGRRLLLARELRNAEVRGELRLAFQPIVALPAGNIVAVEALVRWTSPTFGEVTPDEFISIAEDTGSIVPIGAWVLREGCETMARLAALGYPLTLNVNVSPRQVSKPEYTLWVRQTLAHAQLPADRLALEITETALIRPDVVTKRNLRELDAVGVHIVLDDFGTGYSSLSWLKQRPFGEIKIDCSFVSGLPHNEGDHAIVVAVIGMARAFGCIVTAEGVETQEQLTTLQTLGCDRAQGFMIARPMPADELTALLVSESRLINHGSVHA